MSEQKARAWTGLSRRNLAYWGVAPHCSAAAGALHPVGIPDTPGSNLLNRLNRLLI